MKCEPAGWADLSPAADSPVADPVFVLCMARSGSTLLRFLLDAHPVLACPPETNLPGLCEQLIIVWSLIAGAPLSSNRGDAPPVIPDAAAAGARRTADMIIGTYLGQRGKHRFCDKSLGTARYTDLLLRIYPGARFVCLYRHPMDVIRSGLEACPWGLSGYGFDAYSGGAPGNSVLALARYWLDHASMIAAVEDLHPDRCYRVRYEDLVEDPDEVTAGLFRFLGLPPVPGIAQRCFTDAAGGARERFGPGDHKIWTTSGITASSVGSGQFIPSGLIPPQVAEPVNQLLDKLGYLRVDEDWGTPGAPADPRVPGSAAPPAARAATATGEPPSVAAVQAAQRLEARLRAGLDRIDGQFTARWAPCMTGSFLLVSQPRPGTGGREQCWLVSPAERRLTATSLADADAAGRHEEDGPADTGLADADAAGSHEEDGPADTGLADWSIAGAAEVWLAVLAGEVNLSAALRRWELRYSDPGDAEAFAAQTRVGMLADLLGLTSWSQPQPESPDPGTQQSVHAVAAR